MEAVAVLDFETTGLSPAQGDRATEIAITRIQDGVVIDRFQSLMNAGRRIPAEITLLTGITNAMIVSAPPASEVMRAAADFVGDCPLVAHNAAFDRKFWLAELARVPVSAAPADFACTLLLSRRVYPQFSSHRLGAVVAALGLPAAGRAHRAMADAEMASHLWMQLQRELCERYGIRHLHFAHLMALQRLSRHRVPEWAKALALAR